MLKLIMNTKDSINKRFLETVEFLLESKRSKSKASLARELDIRPNSLSDILGGRQNVGVDVILTLCELYSINIEYQLTGRGEMFRDNGPVDSEKIVEDNPNTNSVFGGDVEDIYNDSSPEEFTNSNGNKFYMYSSDRIVMEVKKIPFKAYASYIETFQDELSCIDDFEVATFAVDHIAKGNYRAFVTEGDSMWNEGGFDTPSGSDVLAREISREYWKCLHKTKYGLIFITETGIFHKDPGVYNEDTGMITLISRNKNNKPFEYPINDVYQIFNVIKRSF